MKLYKKNILFIPDLKLRPVVELKAEKQTV